VEEMLPYITKTISMGNVRFVELFTSLIKLCSEILSSHTVCGTAIFISGTGGSLNYSQISNEMYTHYGIDKPLTIYWKGRDYYLSPIHNRIISEISKLFGQDFFSIDVEKKRYEWAKMMKNEKIRGFYRYSETLLKIANNVFSLSPSIVDLLASIDAQKIAEKWSETLKGARIIQNEFYTVISDIDFNALRYYRQIKELVDKGKNCDSAGIFGEKL